MRHMDDAVGMLVDERWREYARPRFAQGDRTVREQDARASFDAHVENLYFELKRLASRAKWPLDFGVENLKLAVLTALDLPCEYCNCMFGLETWAVSFKTSPSLGGPNRFLFSNLSIGCSRCAVARGTLSARVWIDIVAALNSENDLIAASFLDALVTGQMVQAAAGGGRAEGPDRAPLHCLGLTRFAKTRTNDP